MVERRERKKSTKSVIFAKTAQKRRIFHPFEGIPHFVFRSFSSSGKNKTQKKEKELLYSNNFFMRSKKSKMKIYEQFFQKKSFFQISSKCPY